MHTTSLVGEGTYNISDAARIVHANVRSIRRWALGYRRNETTFVKPILTSDVVIINGIEFLSFRQLIELLFVDLFRQHDISMTVIRAASYNASRCFATENPFALEGLRTDGESIFHIDPDDVELDDSENITQEQIVRDLARAQTVIGEFAKPYFHRIEYHGHIATEYWPMGKSNHIVINPDRSFGSPIDNESGVPTSILKGMYDSGDSIDLISRWYNVKHDAVIDAIKFEHFLLNKAA